MAGATWPNTRIRRANDGEERWISASARAVFLEDQPVRLIGICRDITKEKSVEALFREKAHLAEQLSSVAASVPGVICTFRQGVDGSRSFPYAWAQSAGNLRFSNQLRSIRRWCRCFDATSCSRSENHIDASKTEIRSDRGALA